MDVANTFPPLKRGVMACATKLVLLCLSLRLVASVAMRFFVLRVLHVRFRDDNARQISRFKNRTLPRPRRIGVALRLRPGMLCARNPIDNVGALSFFFFSLQNIVTEGMGLVFANSEMQFACVRCEIQAAPREHAQCKHSRPVQRRVKHAEQRGNTLRKSNEFRTGRRVHTEAKG